MATARIDLDAVSALAEIVVRGGDVRDPRARHTLQQAYRQHLSFPDVQGLSVVFRQGASLDELVRAAKLPYPKVSYATISKLRAELRAAGYDLVLYTRLHAARQIIILWRWQAAGCQSRACQTRQPMP